jgi:hypothetical protein
MASSVIAVPVQKEQYGCIRTALNLFRCDRIWTAKQLNTLNPMPDRISISAGGQELEILRAGAETLRAYKPAVYLYNLGHSVTRVRSGQRITRENLHIVGNGQVYCES